MLQNEDEDGVVKNIDEEFIERTKTMLPENDDGVRNDQFSGFEGFKEEDFILKDEETMLRNSIKKDYNSIQALKIKLEKDLGKNVYREVYKVISEKSNNKHRFSYDIGELTYHIFNELPEFKHELLNEACNKIPDFYSIIFCDNNMNSS